MCCLQQKRTLKKFDPALWWFIKLTMMVAPSPKPQPQPFREVESATVHDLGGTWVGIKERWEKMYSIARFFCCIYNRVGVKCTKVFMYQKYTQVHMRLPINILKNHPWSFQIHPTDSTVHGTARGGPCASGSPLGVLFAPKLKIYVKITHSAHFVFYEKKSFVGKFLDFVL